MSSFKKREKALRRTHRERGQLSSRKQLGLLEKHKDYVKRSRDYHAKEAQLKILHEKARNRNPDEFYFKMVKRRLKDGRHVEDQPEEEISEAQRRIMQTQDIKYVQLKLSSEKKKIERLQSDLHMLEHSAGSSQRTHKIFVDTSEEALNFDPVAHFNTAPELVGRRYNRVNESSMQENPSLSEVDPEAIQHLNRKRNSSYKELSERIKRCQELKSVQQKMTTKQHLMKKERRVRVPGEEGKPATYVWFKERKR